MIKWNKHLTNALVKLETFVNPFCFVDKVSTKRRKFSYSFDSQICSSLTEQRIEHRTYEFRLISLLTTGQHHKDNHSILQEAHAVILFGSDSDNSIVYVGISLLFYNVITLVAGAAIISRQIRTHIVLCNDLSYAWNMPLWKKISCYFISCTVIFEKCKNLVYMNEYGTECKANISAYGFWPNKSIIWYFIHECLILSMKGMHKTRRIYFSEPPRLKLQYSYLHGICGIISMHLFVQLSFKSDVIQNIDHWKCVTVYTLRLTLRPSSITLRSTACYVTVYTRISKQASCLVDEFSKLSFT